MPIVTLEQANRDLRLELNVEDESPLTFDDPRVPDVEMKIAQAEGIVLNYLKVDEDFDLEDSPPPWNDRDLACVQAAVLFALKALYDDEKDRTLAKYMTPETGVIPLLLMRLRDPAIA